MTAAFVTRLEQWADLTPDHIQRLTNLPGRVMLLHRGTTIDGKANVPGGGLLMVRGWAAEQKENDLGKRVITEFRMPGDLFSSRYDPLPKFEIKMLSEVEILALSAATMDAMAAVPQIQAGLDAMEQVRLSIRREWLVNIGSNRTLARLAHLLCEIIVRMEGCGLNSGGVYIVPLTQHDLADALAVTHVHLNKALKLLRIAKLVERTGQQLLILNRTELARVGKFDPDYLMPPIEKPAGRSAAAVPPIEGRWHPTNH